jgi:putative ABC transport system permease protein
VSEAEAEADARMVGADASGAALSGSASVETSCWPVEAWSGGIVAAILIGAPAGLVPAVRASRMPPTVALRTA